MFRYEAYGAYNSSHRNRFTGAACHSSEECWFTNGKGYEEAASVGGLFHLIFREMLFHHVSLEAVWHIRNGRLVQAGGKCESAREAGTIRSHRFDPQAVRGTSISPALLTEITNHKKGSAP
jgi:hypothetical protein